jgi:DNA primase
MSNWVNFKELRKQLRFELVLRHYGVEIKRKGDQHHGFCPLPDHQGKKNSPSFSAHLERGIFQCFGCGAKGNVLEFAGLMESINLEDGAAFRKVVLQLQNRFCVTAMHAEAPAQVPGRDVTQGTSASPRLVNPPLDFELKGLEASHPYLLSRGFTPETITYFGLGFCARGLLKDRIAIPLHDHKGRLIGYAGRVINDSIVSDENPRYKLPSKRERDGKVFEFRKTHFVYNGFRMKSPLDQLIVVEGFTAVWWIHQNGYQQVVGIMGTDCSSRQAQLIVSLVKPNGLVWILSDGDEAGDRCAHSLFTQLAPHRQIRWAKLSDNKQPTNLSPGDLKQLLF